jgi:hypothetical protein
MKSRIHVLLRLRIFQITITIPPHKKIEGGTVRENSKKERKMVKDIIHLQFLMDRQSLFVLCGNIGHVENTCRAEERAMKDAKQFTKDKAQKWKKDKLEKTQSYATATEKSASASASKKNDSDEKKFDKHDFMNAFIKSYDKSRRKSAGKGKRKRSDSALYRVGN